MFRPPILVLLLLAGLISACSGYSDRRPRLVSNPPPSAAGPPRSIPIPASGMADVAPGDTVYAIARRYDVAMRDVIDANNLEAPFLLKVGQSLRLPPPRIYTVAPGDTVYSISRRFGVDMRTLVSMNGLAAPYQVTAGHRLKMPVRGKPEATQTAKAVSTTSGAAVSVPLPRPRPSATVRASTSGGQGRETTIKRSTTRASPLQPPSRGGKRFLWPVRGRIISRFGPREGGLHNDGINIAAPKGNPILAADNGIVAYAGKELRGFGNLLLIKHAGGWTSAYAHANRLLVKRGDRVKRGQTIGTIGTSGGVTRPQLHFELRRGSRAVDPRRELEI
jgi:murein DD-endopeptidase MepM/ murein hydrolase activator NlpD